MDKQKVRELAAYYKDSNPEFSGNILRAIEEFKESRYYYEIAAVKFQKSDHMTDARRCYLNAAECFVELGLRSEAAEMRNSAAECEEYIARQNQTQVFKEGFQRINQTLETGFGWISFSNILLGEMLSRSIIEQAILRAEAQLKSSQILAKYLREGFLNLAERIYKGFVDLSSAQRDSSFTIAQSILKSSENFSKAQIIQAFSNFAGLEKLSKSTDGVGDKVLDGLNSIAISNEALKDLAPALYSGLNSIHIGLSEVAQSQKDAALLIQYALWGRRASRGILAGIGHWLTNDFFRPGILSVFEKKQ